MERTRIKICGVMRPEDAMAAEEAGADAVGMIFHPESKRDITVQRGREIVSALGPFVTPVAVFVNAQAGEVLEVAKAVGVSIVQLNGDESPDFVELLDGRVRVIKAIRVVREKLAGELARWSHSRPANLAAVVMEPGASNVPGGSGVANDWLAIRAAQQDGAMQGLPPLVCAGGLTDQSVGEVIRLLRPWAVDVSSGVEARVGIKSAVKLGQFVSAVRAASDPPRAA